MKTIALVDSYWGGHHPTYMEFFSEALLQLGHRVFVFCPEPEKLKSNLSVRLGKNLKDWHAVNYRLPSQSPIKLSRLETRTAALDRLKNLAQILTEVEQASKTLIDFVFFCYLDASIGQLQTKADFDNKLGRPFSGLYFHPAHLRMRIRYPWFRRGPLNPDAVLLSHYCRSVGVLDEGIIQKLSQRLGGKKVMVFPDITNEEWSESQTVLEKKLRSLAKGRKVVGLLGSLEKRRGLLTMIELAKEMKNHHLFFFAAGQVAESSFPEEEIRRINNFLKNPPENVLIHPEFIEDGIPFNNLVRCCDLIYAVHHNFPHSSNMLTKAACMNVPIVVSDGYLMAERVRRYGLGAVVRDGVKEDVRDLITSEQIFDYKSQEKFRTGCREYMKEHGFEKLRSCLDEAVQGL